MFIARSHSNCLFHADLQHIYIYIYIYTNSAGNDIAVSKPRNDQVATVVTNANLYFGAYCSSNSNHR